MPLEPNSQESHYRLRNWAIPKLMCPSRGLYITSSLTAPRSVTKAPSCRVPYIQPWWNSRQKFSLISLPHFSCHRLRGRQRMRAERPELEAWQPQGHC